MRNELVQTVIQILEDHFVHTLELRLDEDVPAAADVIVTFFQNAGFVPVGDE